MKVHLVGISVRELHGRTYDLVLQGLSAGLTAIYGRNASGKTVLTEAASRVFSATDRHHVDRTDRILGRVGIGETSHDVDLHGPADSVSWPQSPRVGLYRLSVADLIAGPAEEDLQRITDAFAGGVDLQGILLRRAGRKPTRGLQEAWNDLQKRQRESAELRTQEAGLGESRAALVAANQARDDSQLLEGWLNAAAREREASALNLKIQALEQEYPAIDRQAENAPALVQDSYEAFSRCREQLRSALKGLEVFSGQRSHRTLQRIDSETLTSHQSRHSLLTGELAQVTRALATAEAAVGKAQKDLRQCADHVAPVPLSAEDHQLLAEIIHDMEAAEKALQTSAGEAQGVSQALATARAAFRNASGDPEHHPEAVSGTDGIQQIVQCDQDIATASAALEQARLGQEDAQRICKLARQAVPDIRLPARDVLVKLLQDPKIAVLQDHVRGVREQRRALEAVADRWEREAQAQGPRAGEDQLASETLRDWLRMVPETPSPASRGLAPMLAILVALIAAAVGFVVGWGAGAAIGIVGLALLAGLLLSRGRAVRPGQDLRPEVALRVPERWRPAAWTTEAVADRYAAAVREGARLEAQGMVARDARTQVSGVDDSGPARQLQERRDLFATATGVTLGDAYELAGVVHRLQRLTDAEGDLATARENEAAAREKHESLEGKRRGLLAAVGAPGKTGAAAKAWHDALAHLLETEAACREADGRRRTDAVRVQAVREQLRGFLRRFGWPADGDPMAARDGFERWFERTEALTAAQRAVDLAREQAGSLKREIEANAAALTVLFGRYGFPCPPVPADGIKPFQEWFDASRRVTSARSDLAAARNSLVRLLRSNGVPERVPGTGAWCSLGQRRDVPKQRKDVAALRRSLLRDRQARLDQAEAVRGRSDWPEVFGRLGLSAQPSEKAVGERKARLDAVAAEAEGLSTRIVATETRIQQAEKANDLAGFERGMATAVGQMDAWLACRLDEVASQAVIDWIAGAVREEATPSIVESANRHLRDLTGGRYADIDLTGNMLTVADGAEESRRKTVAQLSTGTRVHLALATRLAVIEVSETYGYRFPLLLDEVMATSDPESSIAIAEAMKTVSQERQVLLLTNQPDDLNVLRETVGQDLSVQTLGQIRLPYAQPPCPVPENYPGGLPITSPLGLWPPVLLQRILPELSSSARTVHDAAGGLDAATTVRVMPVLDALEAVRLSLAPACRRLQWGDLASVSWIKPAFRESVQNELEACNGEPRQLLERFRKIGRMREENKQACEEWLQGQGYMVAPPSKRHVVDLARDKLPAAWPDCAVLAEAVAAFFTGYFQDDSDDGASVDPFGG